MVNGQGWIRYLDASYFRSAVFAYRSVLDVSGTMMIPIDLPGVVGKLSFVYPDGVTVR